MHTTQFLKTGDFARLCHTTKETLFHYDREGLFKPALVSENGYRRYKLEQYFDFDLIALLKETGSSLEEIRNYRKVCTPRAYLELFRERVEVLQEERLRLARREAMLRDLIALTEESLDAEYDTLLFEDRQAEPIGVFPIQPEKMTTGAGVIECYASRMAHHLETRSVMAPPLGTIVPEESVRQGAFRLCHLFTRAEADDAGDVRELPQGRYAVWFHKGTFESQGRAFVRMLDAIAENGLRTLGDSYVYDQMSYLITIPEAAEYAAKHSIRVVPQEATL